MAIDYQEILLEAVEIIANNSQLSNNNNDNSNSEKQENKPIPILNPFGQMIQQEKFDIEEGTPGESGNNQISYTWIPQHQTKYDLLGLECNITTNGKATEDGAYGIKIYIKASNGNFEQTFDSSMMLGNPWNFKNMLQKQIFDLEEVSNIQSIRITLYNESNTNVIFDNVFLRLGQSVDNLGESSKPLIIYSDNEPQYTSSADGKFLSGLPQTLYARWIYKKDSNYKAITHLNSEDDIPEGFTLRWYRWTPNSNFGDIYGGTYWSHINGNDNKFSYTIEESSIDPRAEEERYKIIVLQNNLDSDEISVLAESEYYSIKNNIIPVNEQITNRQMKLSDDGKYHFYAWDQEIIDEEFWRSTVQRTATISFETLLGEENFYNAIKSITWRIPEYQTNYVGVATSEIESKDRYSQLTYDKAKLDELKGDGEISDALKEAFTITYQISSHLYNDPMNKIQCIIDIGDGIEYLFEKEIEFDVSGSGGTDTSVIIRMVDEHGNVRAAITPGETLYLEAKVYNAEGEEIEPEKIEWKLLWGKSAIVNGSSFDINDSFTGNPCKIISNSSKLNSDTNAWQRGAAAVKASVIIGSYNLGSEENPNYKNLVIEEIFGVAVAEQGTSYIGPKEILYSSSGTNPQYSKSSVGLLGVELGENETLTVETFPEDINNEYPTIRNNIITPKNSLDMSLENKPFGLIFKKGNSIIWIQPIIIGINHYFSSIINEWDGSLQINEDKNYILSSAYVAGGKNGSNRFTGVVMGELGTISNETISPLGTGLFGYYNGVQSFALTAQGGNGEFSGKITAKQGSVIAGWETTENVFGKVNKNGYGIALSANINNLGNENKYVFAIGNIKSLSEDDWINANLIVDGVGRMTLTEANISGRVTAKDGSIGAWSIGTLNSFGKNSSISEFENSLYSRYYGENENRYIFLRPSEIGDHTAFGILEERKAEDGTLISFDELEKIKHIDLFRISNNGQKFLMEYLKTSEQLEDTTLNIGKFNLINTEWNNISFIEGSINQIYKKINYPLWESCYGLRKIEQSKKITMSEGEMIFSQTEKISNRSHNSGQKWDEDTLVEKKLEILFTNLNTSIEDTIGNSFYVLNSGNGPFSITSKGGISFIPLTLEEAKDLNNRESIPEFTLSSSRGHLRNNWTIDKANILAMTINNLEYSLQVVEILDQLNQPFLCLGLKRKI